MRRLPYVPSRDARHRIAVLALYRALLRSAVQVPLPPDVAAPTARGTAADPMVKIVRRRFDKNRSYTSLRLVYASMAAGYRFLTLLAKARDPESAEHAQVLDHLRTRLESAAVSRAASAASTMVPRTPPPPPPPPPADKLPLIFNTAGPGEEPRYASTVLPRPQDGEEPVPEASLCTTSFGQPFLRMGKPQPRALSRMVGRKDDIYQDNISHVVEINEDLVPEGVLEDEWDDLVTQQIAREYGDRDADEQDDRRLDKRVTYAWNMLLSRLWYEFKIEKTWKDWIARGAAFNQFLDEERIMRGIEKEDRDSALERARQRNTRKTSQPTVRPHVGEWPHTSFPFFEFLKNPPKDPVTTDPDIPPDIPPETPVADGLDAPLEAYEDSKDPFLTLFWRRFVRSQRSRLEAWHDACEREVKDLEPPPELPFRKMEEMRLDNRHKRAEWPKFPEWDFRTRPAKPSWMRRPTWVSPALGIDGPSYGGKQWGLKEAWQKRKREEYNPKYDEKV